MKRGRPKLGAPISIVLTDEQRDWLEAQLTPGNSLASVVRRVIQEAMEPQILESPRDRLKRMREQRAKAAR